MAGFQARETTISELKLIASIAGRLAEGLRENTVHQSDLKPNYRTIRNALEKLESAV